MTSIKRLVKESFDYGSTKIGKGSTKALKYLGKELKDKWLPFGILAGTRACDSISTLMCAEKYGTSDEINELTRNLMDLYGPTQGLLYHNAITLPTVLLSGYLVSLVRKDIKKISKNVSSTSEELRQLPLRNIKRFWSHFSENAPYYIFAGVSSYSAINNLLVYYEFLK